MMRTASKAKRSKCAGSTPGQPLAGLPVDGLIAAFVGSGAGFLIDDSCRRAGWRGITNC